MGKKCYSYFYKSSLFQRKEKFLFMSNITLEQVFGISKDQVLSYYQRLRVDGLLQEALKSDKQIIVYGSSKQGKTALVDKHVPYKNNIVISLSPIMTIRDIYRSILNNLNVELISEIESRTAEEATISVGARVKAMLPFIAGGDASIDSELKSTTEDKIKKTPIEINIELPNDIATIIKKLGTGRFVILENFHYLTDEMQKRLAFDLRSFQELGVRFIILGVWREKNRLTQFNGDLLDRIIEVPVEPWQKEEFRAVIENGSKYLNIKFHEDLINEVTESAFDSIGVVQELIKSICKLKNIVVKQAAIVQVDDKELVKVAISEKVQDYSSRHTRALESIAEGRKSTGPSKDGLVPLYLPYYTVKAFLSFPFDEVVSGIRRGRLETEIKKHHHRSEDVRPSDMGNLLNNLALLQSEKKIVPPIFDYDQATKTIRVVDSTFYFFLRNVDRQDVLKNINDPTEERD